MPRSFVVMLVIASLVALGVGGMLYRRRAMDRQRPEAGDHFWQLRYEVTARANQPGAELTICLPEGNAHCRLLRQSAAHPELQATARRGRFSRRQRLYASAVSAGRVRFNAELDLHQSTRRRWSLPPSAPLTTEARAHYLRGTAQIQTADPLVRRTLGRLEINGKKSRKSIWVLRIYEFCASQLAAESDTHKRDAVSVLQAEGGSSLGRVQAMVALCRAARLPARVVAGFELMDAPNITPHHWVEVWLDNQWVPFDPVNGYVGSLPTSMLPVGYDTTRVVSGEDEIEELMVSYSMSPLMAVAGGDMQAQPELQDIINLRRLPVSMRGTMALLLLLPLGALLTAFVRSVVGLRTFGTFTPSLLALSFVYSDWRTGLLILGLALLLAFGGRAAMDRLRLLTVPRLGLMLTIVVLGMVFAVSVLDYMMLTPTTRVVLLPLVILTMIVERFFVSLEEDGWGAGMKLSGQTFLVAAGCYLLMRWDGLGEFVLTYPEVHLLTVAAFVAIGRYTGYRLTELWRFRDFFDRDAEEAT